MKNSYFSTILQSHFSKRLKTTVTSQPSDTIKDVYG